MGIYNQDQEQGLVDERKAAASIALQSGAHTFCLFLIVPK